MRPTNQLFCLLGEGYRKPTTTSMILSPSINRKEQSLPAIPSRRTIPPGTIEKYINSTPARIVSSTSSSRAAMRSDWLDSTLKRTAASVKWAVNGSFSVNLCLFVIQTFAAIFHGLAGPLRSRDRCIHGSSFVRGHHAHHFADGRPYLNLTNIPWDSAGPKRWALFSSAP
ncbi:uncharacterized protein BDCG_16220 [Blastomyces dermatitidis ER-3]|uniref:Uncharacterized protein n=1 Tax=Ajellomyces dermatitidis (strain ER-3 / ATCC MYA-2586) TaxID=559297 RepID=A0ABX2VQT5_AJEDR|nr:uncharacterized protein BDCG_16220 [Blastomyces dermatitidis ER-3]OAS99598.1 hypothetical protein BDCG_16220 [Blastomyces dermatitidis ER-3]